MLKQACCFTKVLDFFISARKMMQILSNYSRQIEYFLLIYTPEKFKRSSIRLYFGVYGGSLYAF